MEELRRVTYKLLGASKLKRDPKLTQEAKDYPEDKELIDEEIADIGDDIELLEEELSESEDESDSDEELEAPKSIDRFSGKKLKA